MNKPGGGFWNWLARMAGRTVLPPFDPASLNRPLTPREQRFLGVIQEMGEARFLHALAHLRRYKRIGVCKRLDKGLVEGKSIYDLVMTGNAPFSYSFACRRFPRDRWLLYLANTHGLAGDFTYWTVKYAPGGIILRIRLWRQGNA